MDRRIYIAAWSFMAVSPGLAIAATADWSTWAGRLKAGSAIAASIGAALMHPPTTPKGN